MEDRGWIIFLAIRFDLCEERLNPAKEAAGIEQVLRIELLFDAPHER